MSRKLYQDTAVGKCLATPQHLKHLSEMPLQCATKPVVAGFSPRSLSSKRTILSSRRTVVHLHPTNASTHQRKSLFSYPVRFGLSLAVDPRVRVHREMEISTETLIFLVLRSSDLDDRSSALHHPNSTSEQHRSSSEQHRCSPEQLRCSSDLLH